MTENTDQEHLEEPANTHAENTANEIIPKKESETINPGQETENMEVHHHPHHHGKKSWKSYFWEFLMLFLAVTLGFFVENQREHYIENQRAKQYASFLHSDLIKDTASLSQRIAYMNTGIREIDTLILILKSPNPETFVKKIYALSTYIYSNPLFTANNSTIEQLKNSGSLRYF